MRYTLLIFFLCGFSVTNLFAQITLDEYQQKARKYFPLIKQYELIEKTKEFNLSNANKAYLPQLDITLIGGAIAGMPGFAPPGSESSSSSLEYNTISIIQFNQIIWDGGITKAKKEITEATSQIETADLEVSLFALEERINNLYFGILLIDEQLQQLEIRKSTLQRNKKRVEIAVENGTAYTTDVDEIMVEVLNTDQRIEELSSNRFAYLNVLAAMIGEPIEKNAKFEKPGVEENLMNLQNKRPELRLFSSHENLINAESSINKSMLYPKIGVLALGTFIQPGADIGNSTLNNLFIGGLSLNWSLDALYKNNNNKNLTDLSLQKLAVQRETFLFNNQLELTQTQLELDKYKRMIVRDQEILALKTRIKNAYHTKYENGVSTMTDYLNKTNDESVAQQNLIVHEIQYLMKAYEYKNKMGN